jgi:hemerythrin superfamily protein
MPTRMDSMLSTGMGKLKAVKARLKGLTGVFKTLTEQHGEVVALLERAKTSDEKFTQLWPTIKRELISHERAEVRELYPYLRIYPETRAMADHHDAEANTLEWLIAQVDELGIGTQERKDTFQRLIDTVVHHASEEESEIFPKAQEEMGKQLARTVDERFLATKEAVAASIV